MNPVKANMVGNSADYPWSSYRHNALGKKDNLITEHPLYQDLGESAALRAEKYQKIFAMLNTSEQDQQITQATMKGEVYGTNEFHQKISRLIARATKLTAHGGDRKSENYRNQAGCPHDFFCSYKMHGITDDIIRAMNMFYLGNADDARSLMKSALSCPEFRKGLRTKNFAK